jgi:hypothetical protein
VIVAGEKEKLDKVTDVAEVVDDALGDGTEGCEEYPEQPENSIVPTAMMTISTASFFILV